MESHTYENCQPSWGGAQPDVKEDLSCHFVMITKDGKRSDVIVGRAVDLDRWASHMELQLRRATNRNASLDQVGERQRISDSPEDGVVWIVDV